MLDEAKSFYSFTFFPSSFNNSSKFRHTDSILNFQQTHFLMMLETQGTTHLDFLHFVSLVCHFLLNLSFVIFVTFKSLFFCYFCLKILVYIHLLNKYKKGYKINSGKYNCRYKLLIYSFLADITSVFKNVCQHYAVITDTEKTDILTFMLFCERNVSYKKT